MPFLHNNESSKLDPTVKPFPAYQPTFIAPPHSSPTITSYSSSSGIGGEKSKSSNLTSTHHSSSDRGNINAFPHAVLLPPTPVKSFGHGWNSTAPAIPITRNAQSVSVLDTPPIIIPSRARSPSVPNLPSHTQPPAAPAHKVTSNGGVPFPSFTPRRIPSNYQLNHAPLAHHSSVPSLINDHEDSGRFTPTIGRARDVSQWRQGVTSGLTDHAEEEGSNDEHSYSPNNALLSYRSVPAFTAAPTGPTLSGEYNQSRNSESTSPYPLLPLELTPSYSLHPFSSCRLARSRSRATRQAVWRCHEYQARRQQRLPSGWQQGFRHVGDSHVNRKTSS